MYLTKLSTHDNKFQLQIKWIYESIYAVFNGNVNYFSISILVYK